MSIRRLVSGIAFFLSGFFPCVVACGDPPFSIVDLMHAEGRHGAGMPPLTAQGVSATTVSFAANSGGNGNVTVTARNSNGATVSSSTGTGGDTGNLSTGTLTVDETVVDIVITYPGATPKTLKVVDLKKT